MINSKFKSQEGIAAIITVLFITFLSSMIISLAAIILPRLRVSAEVKRSVGALYAADSAMEWCLYRSKDPNSSGPVMQNNATYSLLISGTQNPPSAGCSTPGSPSVKSVGTYQGVIRSLEISGF